MYCRICRRNDSTISQYNSCCAIPWSGEYTTAVWRHVLIKIQLVNGILVGFFPVIASAYIGEVCPVVLRGIMGSMVNLGFVVGRK